MILDAGYFHLHHSTQLIGEADSATVQGARNTAFLISLKDGKTLPDELVGKGTLLKNEHNPRAKDVLFIPAPGEELTFPSELLENIEKIEFQPTPTEIRTLAYGMEKYGDKIRSVAICVDDLGLPAGLAEHLHRFEPEEYKALLKDHPVEYVSERQARNQAFTQIKRALKKINPTRHTAQAQYEQTGCAVMTVNAPIAVACDNGDIAISSEGIIAEKPNEKEPDFVALTRIVNGQTRISCGAFYYGSFRATLKRAPEEELISIYHTQDDPNIASKTFDGFAILSWLEPQIKATATQIIMSGAGAGEKVKTAQFQVPDLSDRGQADYPEFLRYLEQRRVQATPLESGLNVSLTSLNDRSCELPPPKAL